MPESAEKRSESITLDNLSRVIKYWEDTTELYLEYMTTFQAGLFSTPKDIDAFLASNLRVAERAGIKPGFRILDAGCGVCGVSIDLVENIDNLNIEAINISPTQIEKAKELVNKAGLSERIHIKENDYHDTKFESDYFDCVMFLESFGYTNNRKELLCEMYRILKPGGIIYIKDLFRFEQITQHQANDLTEFNAIYAYRTPKLSEIIADIRSTSFRISFAHDVTHEMDRRHVTGSMFEDSGSLKGLTKFGQIHYRGFQNLPIGFFELKARK